MSVLFCFSIKMADDPKEDEYGREQVEATESPERVSMRMIQRTTESFDMSYHKTIVYL